MSANAQHRIHEILHKSGGQVKVTETAVRALAARDHTFLLALVEPYLHGIIAHAIERARKEPPRRPPLTRDLEPLPKKTVKAKNKSVSADVLKGVLDTMAERFSEDAPPAVKTKQASAAHIQSMQALAKKQ